MSEQKPWGPENPHPLSRMKTELVWEGKYDEYGRRREIQLPNFPLVLQKVETIDEPRDRERAEQGNLFDEGAFTKSAHRDDFRNRLIWGDNKLGLSALLNDYRGKAKLIYIDPPFDVGLDFGTRVRIGDGSDRFAKDQSILEDVAYRDTWGQFGEAYPSFLSERLSVARDLLSEDGFIVVHVGDKVGPVVRGILETIFGAENYRSTIIVRRGTKNVQSQFENISALSVGHDYLFLFSKRKSSKLKKLTLPGEDAKPGKWDTFWRGTDRPTMRYELLGVKPNSGQWRWKEQRAQKAIDNYSEFLDSDEESLDAYYTPRSDEGIELDFLRLSDDGVVQYFVPPRDYKLASTNWTSLRTVGSSTDYDTEKHEELLHIVVSWLTDDSDLVLDFFCGSGTTLAVAEELNRKWIGIDLGRYAVHTTRKRLIGVQRELHKANLPYRSFDVYNLGRYERQWWQAERLKGANEEHRATVLKFFRANTIQNPPSGLIHGTKGGAYVHIDNIDSIFTINELREVAKSIASVEGLEDWQNHGTVLGSRNKPKLIVLAWEFEMDLRRRVEGVEAETGVEITLKYIPREIMEPNRDTVQFFDAAALDAEVLVSEVDGKKQIDVKLTNFYPALTEVPDRELNALKERAVKSPFDFIDFWAVDFDYQENKPFEHHWQDYRTRKDRSLKAFSDLGWEYETPGTKRICVKVIDVFGIDTTKVIEVKV